MLETIATVIIPTFGNATFAGWAIKSVQNQTVKNIEICIICDGSPENMVSFFRNIEKEDSRVKVFVFPKSPRTGEPYRDIIKIGRAHV
jgi:glycosyltransferase involved in cell wall biosynthesis